MKILGHIVSGEGVRMDPVKIEAIRNIKEPRNVKQLQQFLGLTGYYRKFVKDYAKVAAPLYELLKKDVCWIWSDECRSAFQVLRDRLVEYPTLRQPDFDRTFILFTDASGVAIGAILAQKDINNREYVCAYASKMLKGGEINYGISEKECLAVVWAIRHYRVYLYGMPFKVVTDHMALKWLMNMTDPTGRLARWAVYLQAFEFEIIQN